MLNLLTLFAFKYTNLSFYPGNWTASFNNRHNVTVNSTGKFKLIFEPLRNISGYDIMPAWGTFYNSTEVKFGGVNQTYAAFLRPNHSCVMIHIDFPIPITVEDYVGIVNNVLAKNNMTEPFDSLVELKKNIDKELLTVPDGSRSRIMYVEFVNETNQTHEFAIQESIVGRIIFTDDVNLTFVGSRFDLIKFSVEGKKFGVVAGLSAVLLSYAWYSLAKNFVTDVSIMQLSMSSIILNVGVDFGYALLILEIGLTDSSFRQEYIIIFTCLVLVYFIYQMRMMALLLKSNGNFGEGGWEAIHIKFFSQITVLMSISSFAVSLCLDMPILFLPYVYSYFIPQIIYSARHPSSKKKDKWFVILVTIARLMPLWYFTIYPLNINGATSLTICIIFTMYAVLQAVIILLQNKFGGAFFLPKSARPQIYDYTSVHVEPGTECSVCMTEILEGDETMTTPCQHSFHKECLERWMEEKLVCPMCRAALPPNIA